ncbi:MAG: hypothetical protein NT094_02005, partial [Candidatus Staskawiczbacteria bacterium]|nr:hypothetical protein [Candidatus Staskawiczbacteria bacterium]
WAAGTKQTIRWTPSSTGTVRLEIRKGTSQYVMIGSGGIPDTGSYVWSIPTGFALASDYRVRVTRSDGAGPYDESNNPFSVITTKKW